MANPPAGYEEVAAPSGGPPPGYEEVAPPNPIPRAVRDKLRATGATPTQFEQQHQGKGGFSAFMNDVGGLIKGIPNALAAGLPITTPEAAAHHADVMGSQAQAISDADAARKAEGHGLPYRATATVAQGLGVNVPGMEQAARQGDVSGVLGHAAAPAVIATAPMALRGAGTIANRVIPSTTRAGIGLNMLTDSPEAAFAQRPAETPNTLATARKIESELAVTGEKPHPIVQHYIAGEELRNMPPELQDMARQQGIEPNQPMTMYEARTMLKRVNDVIRNSRGFAADTQAKTAITNLKRFANALDQDISANAERMGFGQDYEAMKNEYRAGKQIVRAGEEIGAPVGALAGYTVGRELGEPLGGTLAGGMIGKAIGRRTTGAAARALVERNAGPPRLRSLPQSPEAYQRILLDAKEGKISPGEADRRISRSGGRVRVNPIPQFQEEE